MDARLGPPGGLVGLALLLVACAGGSAPPAAPAVPTTTAPAGGTAAAGAPAAPAAVAPPLMTVKTAALPSISNGGRYIAIERGYFREAGIEVEDVEFDTSAKMLPALAA